MRIDFCPYSKYCGDKGNDNSKERQIWYCPRSGNKDWCPYDKCETPTSKPKPIPKPEPVKTEKEIAEEATMAKDKLMAERFKIAKQMEEEGLSRSQAAQRLGISYYTIESLEERYGYKFNFAAKTKIPWKQYDAKIIELKTSGKKMTTEEIARIIGLKHRAVANRWTILKRQLEGVKACD